MNSLLQTLLILAATAAVAFSGSARGSLEGRATKPNFVFIISDDQDVHLNSLDYMPLLQSNMTEKGTKFTKHYCTVAQCCPSRVTLWTGKAAHNTNVTDVKPPYGGWPKFVSRGLDKDYFPIWMQKAGYNTYYTGKLMNAMTKDNYKDPGWTQSDVLLDPYTYVYYGACMKKNGTPPASYKGQYSTDVIKQKGLDFIHEAYSAGKPFFVGIAPIAPHVQTQVKPKTPVPAKRHGGLFPGVTVNRTPDFNPDKASGASYVKDLLQLTSEVVEYNDMFYRKRLQALQAVDELVEAVVSRVEDLGLLNNTYIIYTSDNGYHIGQHRMNPGKSCAYETDINVPFIIRGPGIATNAVRDYPTTHTDLVPTIFNLAGLDLHDDFDGTPIPVKAGNDSAARYEHVGVEFWGDQHFEGKYHNETPATASNNTYKSVRVVGGDYSLSYTVWCTNEHELYDMLDDPYQMNNLVPGNDGATVKVGAKTYPVSQIKARLDALVQVLRTCKSQTCLKPWAKLHPQGDVENLVDALNSAYDDFYTQKQVKMEFGRCAPAYYPKVEGPGPIPYGGIAVRDDEWEDWT